MKNYLIFAFILFFINIIAYSQDLPDDRRCDWSQAGLMYKINWGKSISVISYGADYTGKIPCDDAIQSVIDEIGDVVGTIYFPPGNYLLKETIRLRSGLSIRGYAGNRPNLNFDLDGESSCIIAAGRRSKDTILLTEDVAFGDKTLQFSTDSEPNAVNYYYIIDDDSDKISSDWAKFTTGQILVLNSISNGSAQSHRAIRREYLVSKGAKLIELELVNGIAIESIIIHNNKATTSQTSNIDLTYAHNCKIKCVESYNSNFAHINLHYCKNIEIEGSYFQDAHAYGGGGQGYGIVVQAASNDCLVYNNIFNHLRHSILIQSGANGNVSSYNYSIDPYWTDVTLPEDAAGDLVCHGNYPYLNLFESNICQNIVIDDSHGINGPFNTFFRNRAENYGIFMNFAPASDEQNFIGNEIPSTALLKGLYFLSGNDHFEYGNNVKGTVTPSNTSDLTMVSYYSGNYKPGMPWIGYPNELNAQDIPAKTRFLKGLKTACDDDDTSIKELFHKSSAQTIYFPQLLEIIENKDVSSIQLFNTCGKQLATDVDKIRTINLAPGIYFVILQTASSVEYYRVII
jgi:Pectate lyase superfamily protein